MCGEAFRPYSAVLANLTGICYWWGWVPTCGLTVAAVCRRAARPGTCPACPVTPLADRHRAVFTAPQPAAASQGDMRLPSSIAPALGGARLPVRGRARLRRHASTGSRRRTFTSRSPFDGVFGVGDQRDGRAVPGRLRRARLRGGRLPRRRDDRPEPQRAARHATPAPRWPALFFLAAAGRLARACWGRTRWRATSRQTLGPTFAPLLGGARQGGRRLAHGVQHVPRHAAAAGRRVAHAVPAVGGRPAARVFALRSAARRAVGGHRRSPQAWPSPSCSSATRSG